MSESRCGHAVSLVKYEDSVVLMIGWSARTKHRLKTFTCKIHNNTKFLIKYVQEPMKINSYLNL